MTDLYRGEGEGVAESVATSVGRKPLGDRVLHEDKNSGVEFGRAAGGSGKIGKERGKGRVCGFRPFPLFVFHREFHPANRATPSSLSSLAFILPLHWKVVARHLRDFIGGRDLFDTWSGMELSTVFFRWTSPSCARRPRSSPSNWPTWNSRGSRTSAPKNSSKLSPRFVFYVCVCMCVCLLFYSCHVLTMIVYSSLFSFLGFEDVDW